MNDQPNSPEPGVQPAPANPPAATAPSGGLFAALAKPLPATVAVLAVLLLAQTWSSNVRINNLRGDVARSLQKGDATAADTAKQAREVAEQVKDLQVKVGVLESRQQEAQSQQAALEQMYQELSKNRDEWALSEIEQVLSTASQQLQLAGNVQGALIALANADRSLSRSDKPQFITIRRAIARDMEKLRALPSVDIAGVALRLDNVIGEIDGLPMLSAEQPAPPAPPAPPPARPKKGAKAAAAPAPQEPGLTERLGAAWHAWSSEMWSDVRQLVRVRTVNTPEALMLSPGESYFVRENLKLRLLNARLALLSRNESTFRDDLNTAQQTLVRYFDTRARATQAAQAGLRQVQANNLAIEMPSLADSLNAVRNYKSKP